MSGYDMRPRAFYARGGPRRSYVAAARAKPGDRALPDPHPLEAPPACPGAILDTAPDGTGLGIWVLVAEDEDTCTYEYGGGIG